MKKLLVFGLIISLFMLTILTGGCGTGASLPPAEEPPPAVKLAFTTQPSEAISGLPFDPQPVVAAVDEQGNIAASHRGLVVLTITTGNGAAGANLFGGTKVALVDGVVKFRELHIDKAGPGYTLTATSGKLASATSSTFTVSPGAPAKLEFSVQPSGGIAGTPLKTQPEVIVQDSNGNKITSYEGSVTLSITPVAGLTRPVLYGTTTAKVANGVARFTDISIQRSFFAFTLAATSGALVSATSSFFKVSPAAPAMLEVTVHPAGAIAGLPFDEQPKVAIEDIYGNVVTGSTAPVTVAITPGTGTSGAILSGTTTLDTEDGLAVFEDLSIDLAGSGYTLTATSGVLTPHISQPFNVDNP